MGSRRFRRYHPPKGEKAEGRSRMVEVRLARASDAAAIARIHVEAWRASYPGIQPQRMLVDMSERRRRAVWATALMREPGLILVGADAFGAVAGFGSFGRRRDGDPSFAGEIFTLYVAPDRQNRGIGRALMHGMFERLLRLQLDSALVWVLRANPARFFYERLGGRLCGERLLPVGGIDVEAVAYGWRDLGATLRDSAPRSRWATE
jgi:ribosomal protein S18 acetylase RimI-like enzyme